MKSISVYDEDDVRIDEICDKKDIPACELISALLDAIESGEINVDDIV